MLNRDIFDELLALGIEPDVARELVNANPAKCRQALDTVYALPSRNWFSSRGYVLSYVRNIAPPLNWLLDAFEDTKEAANA